MNISISDTEAVRTVTINRPHCRNAVNPETARELYDAFADFDANERLHAAVLTGAEGNFCAGFDLNEVGVGQHRYEPEGDGPMGPSRMLLSKPVIAAVEGYAVAGGLELALWCDMRVASETAIFGVFCRRWGVPLIDGGTVRLPRIIGQGRALDMVLTGRPVKADEALAIGLANRVTSAGCALSTAQELAAQIGAFPQTCVRTDRMSAYRQWDLNLAEALKFEGREGKKPLREEAAKGAKRFVGGEGRSGDFIQGTD